jgi:hypothetical protein
LWLQLKQCAHASSREVTQPAAVREHVLTDRLRQNTATGTTTSSKKISLHPPPPPPPLRTVSRTNTSSRNGISIITNDSTDISDTGTNRRILTRPSRSSVRNRSDHSSSSSEKRPLRRLNSESKDSTVVGGNTLNSVGAVVGDVGLVRDSVGREEDKGRSEEELRIIRKERILNVVSRTRSCSKTSKRSSGVKSTTKIAS